MKVIFSEILADILCQSLSHYSCQYDSKTRWMHSQAYENVSIDLFRQEFYGMTVRNMLISENIQGWLAYIRSHMSTLAHPLLKRQFKLVSIFFTT